MFLVLSTSYKGIIILLVLPSFFQLINDSIRTGNIIKACLFLPVL